MILFFVVRVKINIKARVLKWKRRLPKNIQSDREIELDKNEKKMDKKWKNNMGTFTSLCGLPNINLRNKIQTYFITKPCKRWCNKIKVGQFRQSKHSDYLRHTFCVNALIKMSETGNDLYHTMPILMIYMGHKTLVATNRYVRIT